MNIIFDGVEFTCDINGMWHCPFNCQNPNYPERVWATEKGIRKHLLTCKNSPSNLNKQEQLKQLLIERHNINKKIALLDSPYKIGDKIIYVRKLENPVRFEAISTTIKTLDWDEKYIINEETQYAICRDLEYAQKLALEKQEYCNEDEEEDY